VAGSKGFCPFLLGNITLLKDTFHKPSFILDKDNPVNYIGIYGNYHIVVYTSAPFRLGEGNSCLNSIILLFLVSKYKNIIDKYRDGLKVGSTFDGTLKTIMRGRAH
jgi:hypothetical protein